MNHTLRSPSLSRPFQFNPWRELAGATRLGMELSWMALLYHGFSQQSAPVPFGKALAILGVVFFGVYYLARSMDELRLRKWIRRSAAAVLAVLSLVLALELLVYAPDWVSVFQIPGLLLRSFTGARFMPGEYWVLLAILLIWLRAVILAAQPVELAPALGSFKLGILAFVYYGFLRPEAVNPVGVGAFLLFSTLGLVSLSTGRMYEISQKRGGKQTRFSGRWLGGITLTIFLVLGIGLLASYLAHDPLNALIRQIILLLLKGAAILYLLIVSPMLLILMALLPLIARLRELTGAPQALTDITEQLKKLIQMFQAMQPEAETRAFPPEVRAALLLIVLVVIFGLLLSRMQWRWRLRRRASEEEVEEMEGLAGLLRRLRSRSRKSIDDLRRGLNLKRARDWIAAARIRWVYLQLMELSARLGKPRPVSATPLEYLPVLNGLFPEQQSELETITRAYVQVRYGEYPETEGEVRVVQSAWDRIRRMGSRMKKPKK